LFKNYQEAESQRIRPEADSAFLNTREAINQLVLVRIYNIKHLSNFSIHIAKLVRTYKLYSANNGHETSGSVLIVNLLFIGNQLIKENPVQQSNRETTMAPF
jgi:hypothetical protein